MTGDDMGASLDEAQSEKYSPRARQNVILEMGYFMGSLGRRHVCVLKSDGVDTPSDILGVVYHQIDGHGAWKTMIDRELKAAGYDVDMNLIG